MATDVEGSSPNRSASPRISRQQVIILAGTLIVACLVGGLQWRSLRSARDTLTVARGQLTRMRADVAAIMTLRDRPRSAVGRTRPHETLLAQVEQALSASQIDRSHWRDSIPQPPVRLPKSDFRRMTTSLELESITMRQIATFAHELKTNDPTLGVTGLRLTNRHEDRPEFDVEVDISYLVYAPQTTARLSG